MMKKILAVMFLTATTSLNAEALSFRSFEIDLLDDWEYSLKSGADDSWGSVLSARHPSGVGTLTMQSYDAPRAVSEEILRNMTNVDASIPLVRQRWGDYSGYQHNYTESGVFFRHWWLANDRTIRFITYQCDPESRDVETEAIYAMIRSLAVNDV